MTARITLPGFCIILLISGCQSESGATKDKPTVVAPVAIDDTVTTREDTEVVIEPLANDNGDTLRLNSVSLPREW